MTSNPDESPNSPSNPLPAESSSASSRDWVLVIARILFLLALVLIVIPMYELLNLNENTDMDAFELRVYFYTGTIVCLFVSSVTIRVRQFQLHPNRALMASRILDAPQYGTLSLNDIQKKGGKKKLLAWLWDAVSTIAGVFLFALGACTILNTQPILAAVFLTMAILFPSMVKSSQRLREAISDVPPKDE